MNLKNNNSFCTKWKEIVVRNQKTHLFKKIFTAESIEKVHF